MSDQSKYTPGEWKLELSDDVSRIRGDKGKLIAEVGTWMEIEDEANARLIAAAPDTAAALETLIKTIRANHRIYWNNALHKAVRNAEIALDKGRGEGD